MAARIGEEVRFGERLTRARELARSGARRVRALFPGWTVADEAIADSPYWAVVRRADELHADLVVVGSQGRSAVGRAVIGSVSQRVLRHAPCSVRVGRRPVEERSRTPGPVKLLLGIDGSESFDIRGVSAELRPQQDLTLVIHRAGGETQEVPVLCRIDTPIEVDYYRHGGILPYVLREILRRPA